MSKCTYCEHDAVTACDHCGHINFCAGCYKKNMVECMCRSCIMLSRDCHHCADTWRADGIELALVCPTCVHGYCGECVVKNENAIHCPQCYERVELEHEPETDSEHEPYTASESETDDEADEPDSETDIVSAITNQMKSVSTKARPDNVKDIKTKTNRPYTMHEVTAQMIVTAQATRYLSHQFGIKNVDEFLTALTRSGAHIVGNSAVEIMLGTIFGGDMEIVDRQLSMGPALLASGYHLISTEGTVKRYTCGGTREIVIIAINPREYLNLKSNTIIQTAFDGERFHTSNLDILLWRGHGEISRDILQYRSAGFDVMVPLTDDIIAATNQ